jgi:predicted CxxxxCH...CXXCH cytochrome family protein
VKRGAALPGLLLVALVGCSSEREGTPTPGGVHPAGFAAPLSSGFHGTLLRSRRWSPMLDRGDPEACGLCHDGVASRPDSVTFPAPGAPSCTSCHQEGVLACTTCHGEGTTGSHPRHLAPTSQRGAGLACASCHPLPGPGVIGGMHGNGQVDLVFDPGRIPAGASYDPASKTCSLYCHDQGGARATPSWGGAPMACGDCHGAPPAKHYAGTCSTCHIEATNSGNSLLSGPLHLNGKVDLGDGSGTCAACHGRDSGGWPATGAHASHRAPTIASPVDCASCHPTYDSPAAPGHLDGVAHVVFGPRALDRGAMPAWDGQSCAGVACHGAGLQGAPLVVPSWQDTTGAASQCGACHGIPPLQHTPSTDCGRSDCHTGEIKRAGGLLSVSPEGRARHIDGLIEVNR